jgi:hypothetical protein
VTEATLTSRLMAARKAIGDRERGQRLIQTLHGRGYRFVAPVEERSPEATERQTQRQASSHAQTPPEPAPLSPQNSALSTVPVVGRQAELEHLRGWLQKALEGTRQIVFVTGEAGLGKTTMIDAFIAEARALGVQWVGRGQCIEHYGAGETYMPVLEAWGQLCRDAEAQVFVDVLARQAPTWLVQLPWLVSDATYEALERRGQGATRERMLREMAETIEVLTAVRPLILVIDDLHWSDYATLDLVALLAQRRQPARFFLLSTYRPEAVRANDHPLQGMMQGLQLHQHCQELSLSALSATEVEAYLAARLMNDVLARSLSPTLHSRTEGKPTIHGQPARALDGAWLAVPTARAVDTAQRLGGHRPRDSGHLAGAGHTAASPAPPDRTAPPRGGQCLRAGVFGGLDRRGPGRRSGRGGDLV